MIRKGDTVEIKLDYEEIGTVVKVKGAFVEIELWNDETGETYIVTEHRSRCHKVEGD